MQEVLGAVDRGDADLRALGPPRRVPALAPDHDRPSALGLLEGAGRSRGVARPFDWDQLQEPESDLSRAWDREHVEFVARRLLELMEVEFSPTTWRAFRRQVLDGLKPAEVAAELGTSVNAVLLAKSRVLARVRKEGRGLID